MRFVDLFAGLGGFHVALGQLGHQCVFASEIDEELRKLYKQNFGFEPAGDIRECYSEIPNHDVLCAGFPCQPFSKAGGQLGFACPDSGDLFEFVIKVLRKHRPSYVILENVPNILNHGQKKTFENIQESLAFLGYQVRVVRISPHQIGVPQKRDRVFILASRLGFRNVFEPIQKQSSASLTDLLDRRPEDARLVSAKHREYLEHWQKFLDLVPPETRLSAFPIWAMEFGATYPVRGKVPLARPIDSLRRYKGQFGIALRHFDEHDIAAQLPPYARMSLGVIPRWKGEFIRLNREFFRAHSKQLKGWLRVTRTFPASFQKLEWNWKEGPRRIDQGLIQFRASGIRVRSPAASSSLVAINASQVPIIGWEMRYLTSREGARLQSLESLRFLPTSHGKVAEALGNAVNTAVVSFLADRLIGRAAPLASAG